MKIKWQDIHEFKKGGIMNKLEVGMFVKFKDKNGCTYIRKVIDGYKEHWYGCKVDKNANNVPYVSEKNIINYSFNIIDLIVVGDYVNGLPVASINGTRYDKNDLRVWLAVATEYKEEYGVENSDGDYKHQTLYRCIKPENIKSIVTKEQFESMKYEVE